MAHLREESLNSFLALRLDQHDGIHVAPERRDAGAAVGLTIGHRGAADHARILIEAKIGHTPLKCQEAAKQARRKLLFEPRALAFALCYPCQLSN